jgi:hypothetical protein
MSAFAEITDAISLNCFAFQLTIILKAIYYLHQNFNIFHNFFLFHSFLFNIF